MKPELPLLLRWALTVFCLPFLLAGILLTGSVVTLLTNSLSGWWFILLFFCLVPIGILLGGLVAYGIIVFFLTWASPNHPLLEQSEEKPGFMQRLIGPAFGAVRTFAIWLAPKRRHTP